MAWVFSLSADCGTARAGADAFAAHYRGKRLADHQGKEHACECYVYEDDGWWATVWFNDVSGSGINSEFDRLQFDALAKELYAELKGAPSFRFALVGVEVDSCRTFSELDQDVVTMKFDGMVLCESIWRRLGQPSIYTPFRPGYYWREFVTVA